MWRVGLTFDLPFDLLTWISIVIIYSSRTIYLPCLKLLGQSFLELLVAQGVGDTDMTFDLDLLTWISIGIIYLSRTIYLPSLKLLRQSVLELSVAQGMGDQQTFDLEPTDLKINRDHLLILDYLNLPTKFEACRTKHCWVITCTRYRRSTWPFFTLTFDLLIWISIGIIYSSRTIYLPSLKLLGQSVLELSVAQ